MKFILSLVLVFVLSSAVYAQHRHRFTPTPQMRIDQIYHQEHMNRAIPRNWIDYPPYRYQHYYYPPIYSPYQYQPYFYNPYRNFGYGVTINNGSGFYLSYSF